MRHLIPMMLAFCYSGQVASAQIKTTTFEVRLSIESECAILDLQDLDFGKAGVLDQDVDAESSVIVQCTNGTPYNIAVDSGQNSILNGARRMTGRDGRTVEYGLFADPARTKPIGDVPGKNVGDAVGNGGKQLHPLYGRVIAQATPGPGDYFDIVTLTVSY